MSETVTDSMYSNKPEDNTAVFKTIDDVLRLTLSHPSDEVSYPTDCNGSYKRFSSAVTHPQDVEPNSNTRQIM